jgi:uncharacterized protein (DUF2267 family)
MGAVPAKQAAVPQQPKPAASKPPATDTQNYLLQLLSQPKPAQYDTAPQLTPAKILTPPSKTSSQDDPIEAAQALEHVAVNAHSKGAASDDLRPDARVAKDNKDASRESTPQQGLFTYVNPFEQLAASSPRNRTPKIPSGQTAAPPMQILKRESADNKRKTDARSSSSTIAQTNLKFDSPSQASSSPPTPLPDGRTPLEALIGIGASAPADKETVSDALSNIGNKVDRQAREAIAQAEKDETQAEIENDIQTMLDAKTEQEFQESAQTAAQTIQKELAKSDNQTALDDLPKEVADAVKDIVDDAAHGHIADSWESAEADETPSKEEENAVKVYNFPMKPWTAITINKAVDTRPVFREDAIMDIARLKKEFDHIDRTLVTASSTFIVYGMSKNGGFRIIRQDDGRDTRLFTETHDRIFNVVTSCAPADLKEAIIGTGISGTVYWALIKDGEGDSIEEGNLEQHGFAMPPTQSHDSESPGGVLKTRARKSANHPSFFAVGRGKYIHIIWPSVIMKSYLKDGKDRIVDTEKYLAEHSLKVNTGKAGKDFAFSEDDTTIVSLDKAGRVKFWDVRALAEVDSSGNPHPIHTRPIEIKEPIITLTTTPPTEKSWPTSVLFVDKLRPYQRGGPLRYLIVGMKQNHTLQLWDLALGKPVQEIHLPHSQDADAVCSVVYHPATGMIVVGHPTRNSIYFLHLSAPRYYVPKGIDQAEYIQKLANSDPSIPKPEATAVVSGMREYSLETKGLLRSLDILPTPASSTMGGDAETLFELYAMHSKGVTCLAVKQSDLGWSSENKVLRPVDAAEVGAITIETIREVPSAATPEVTDTKAPVSTRSANRAAGKEAQSKETTKKAAHAEPSARPAAKSDDKVEKRDVVSNGQASASGTEKPSKNKRRKATASSEAASGTSQGVQPSKAILMDPLSNSRNGNAKPSIDAIPQVETQGASRPFSDATLRDIETRISGEIKQTFNTSLESLLQDLKLDRRTQNAVAKSEQEAILRVVSNTLNDNIEVSLSKIVNSSIQKSVLPAISEVAKNAVKEQLGSSMNSHLGNAIPRELQKSLPNAVENALQQPQLLSLMSDTLARSVAFRVEEQFATLLHNVVSPAFTKLAVQTSQNAIAEIQRQVSGKIEALEQRRSTDDMKITQLMKLVTGLTETVTSMAAAQTDFQGQFLRLQQQATTDRREASQQRDAPRPETSVALAAPAPAEEQRSQQELQFEALLNEVHACMQDGSYETAIIRWLQSGLHQEFFEDYLYKFSPDFVQTLNPLLLLSIGSAISGGIENRRVLERLTWLEVVLMVLQAHVSAQDMVCKV